MADWIKWTKGLVTKPEVFAIAAALHLDRHEVAGRLMVVWEWADGVTVDGHVDAPVDAVDVVAGVAGFGNAMKNAGWLSDNGSVTFPHFDRHNGASAKARSLKSERQARWRDGKDGDAKSVDGDASTREEKIREEFEKEKKEAPQPPANQGQLLDVPPVQPEHKKRGAPKLAYDEENECITGITEKRWQKWEAAFPAVNVRLAVQQATVWLVSNPEQRKQNYSRFLTNWMKSDQEKGGGAARKNGAAPAGQPASPQPRGKPAGQEYAR